MAPSSRTAAHEASLPPPLAHAFPNSASPSAEKGRGPHEPPTSVRAAIHHNCGVDYPRVLDSPPPASTAHLHTPGAHSPQGPRAPRTALDAKCHPHPTPLSTVCPPPLASLKGVFVFPQKLVDALRAQEKKDLDPLRLTRLPHAPKPPPFFLTLPGASRPLHPQCKAPPSPPAPHPNSSLDRHPPRPPPSKESSLPSTPYPNPEADAPLRTWALNLFPLIDPTPEEILAPSPALRPPLGPRLPRSVDEPALPLAFHFSLNILNSVQSHGGTPSHTPSPADSYRSSPHPLNAHPISIAHSPSPFPPAPLPLVPDPPNPPTSLFQPPKGSDLPASPANLQSPKASA